MITALVENILSMQDVVVELQRELTSFAALGPENGGQGEIAKAQFIENWLAAYGINDIHYGNSPDSRVESGIRPNLICKIPGRQKRMLWLFGHLDVVPAGNLCAWESDPWQIHVKDDRIYGRGVEDNQQAVCSMLVLASVLARMNMQTEIGLGLIFMADEETGSQHGMKWLLNQSERPFSKEDYYIVPDGGSPDGRLIEIAEKGQLWLRFIVIGRQCHASTPYKGKNSLIAASQLVLELNQLNEIFERVDPLFEPPRSTFVPSKHDGNVEAINILPGRDVFYLDCRLLPGLSSEAVLAKCAQITTRVAADYGIDIDIEIVQKQKATSVSPESPVVRALSGAIEKMRGVKPVLKGIGGATVAAFLREAGFDAIVWSTIANTCHQPNEYSSIAATLMDAAVFACIIQPQEWNTTV